METASADVSPLFEAVAAVDFTDCGFTVCRMGYRLAECLSPEPDRRSQVDEMLAVFGVLPWFLVEDQETSSEAGLRWLQVEILCFLVEAQRLESAAVSRTGSISRARKAAIS